MSPKKAVKLKPAQPLRSWSPSTLKAYEECALRLRYEKIERLCQKCFGGEVVKRNGVQACTKCRQPPPPEGEALAKGNVIHKAAELYIRGLPPYNAASPKIPDGLKNPKVAKLLKVLRQGYKDRVVRVELELAFTSMWKPTDWRSSDAWVRMKMDVIHLAGGGVVRVLDWKTGRFKPGDFEDPLNTYAVGALTAGLGQRAEAQLVFTEEGQFVPKTAPKAGDAGWLDVKDLKKAQKEWEARVKPMLTDTSFSPRPGDYCRYCPFSRNKGGPCEF